jgi:hypothetical protein
MLNEPRSFWLRQDEGERRRAADGVIQPTRQRTSAIAMPAAMRYQPNPTKV